MKLKSKVSAEVLADSINAATGDRLTTFRVRVPKFLLAEINTHRSLSKNFASSRAIPASKIRHQVLFDPFVPTYFGANQKGMQAKKELTGIRLFLAKQLWLKARLLGCFSHWVGEKIGLHKQLVNRILEPWMWADGVISGTEWNNFFALRCHEDAQPEFRQLAEQIECAHKYSEPKLLQPGEWHLPFTSLWDVLPLEDLKRVSTARCARVSYLLRENHRSNLDSDIELCNRLMGSNPKHLSPAEHPGMALPTKERIGNYVGWKQYRKFQENESGGDYK